jgi:hypothetical protein
MQNYNYKINKVAIGFDYNEKKETNILNSFYVEAQARAEYNFPNMCGITNIKMNFSSDSISGYICNNVFSDGAAAYLSGSVGCGNLSLPNICDLSCPEEEECDRSIDGAAIDFKLGRFSTQSIKVGADHGDAENRIHLDTTHGKMLNGLEVELKNNKCGDMSAAWFKGTSENCGARAYEAFVTTAPSTWINGASGTYFVKIDPTGNKALLERLQIGDKIEATNVSTKLSEPLYGLGVITEINKVDGKIKFSSAVLSVSTTKINTATKLGDTTVAFKTANTPALVEGNGLYGGADINATNDMTELAATFIAPSPHTGIIALGTATAGATVVADQAIMGGITGGVQKVVAANAVLITSTGKHFTTVPVVCSKITFKFAKECAIDNNITGFRLKLKLGNYGSIGYEDVETKDLKNGIKTKDNTTALNLGCTDLGELDQVTRSASDILSKISFDWVNHETKVGTGAKTKQTMMAAQYKLSDDISLMYGQKENATKKKSDIYGMNYKMDCGNGSKALLKVRGQTKVDDNSTNKNKLQIQMVLPTDLVQYTNQE